MVRLRHDCPGKNLTSIGGMKLFHKFAQKSGVEEAEQVSPALQDDESRQELQDYLVKNKSLLKDKIRGFFCICGNNKQPTGPRQVKQLIDNHLSQITGVSGVPVKAFNGRITIDLVEPQYKNMVRSFGDYDFMKRADFLEFGKTILASIK